MVPYLQQLRALERGCLPLSQISQLKFRSKDLVSCIGKTLFVVFSSLVLLMASSGRNPLLAAGSAMEADEMAVAIQNRLEAANPRHPAPSGRERPSFTQGVKKFYARHGFRPAWVDREGPLPLADALLNTLQKAPRHGLRPEDYHLAAIEDLLSGFREFFGHNSLSAEESANLDLHLTDAFFLYASDLASGRMKGDKKKAHWYLRERVAPDLAEALEEALDSGQVQPVLESLAPITPSYVRLRMALFKYREIDRRGGWPFIPSDAAGLKKGDKSRRVALLRKRLRISGDLNASDHFEVTGRTDLFDESLDQAVRTFQQRHGLFADGAVGPETLEALNVPVAQRIRQIEVNLERLRWIPEDTGDQVVVINIPEFRLRVLEGSDELMNSRIVVGKYARNTPVFESRISHFILNPYWYVPRSITIDEVVPLILKYPEYFYWENMKVLSSSGKVIPPWEVNWEKVTASNFKYQLRQEPGPKNPLGRIKFIFPNPFDVYLHDTPDRHLFEKTVRSFSHGCIRVEKTTDLAMALLKGKPSREELVSAMDSGEMKTIRLPQTVEIQVLYFTAWADADGFVQFREDIYRYDAPLQLAMEQAAHRTATEKD